MHKIFVKDKVVLILRPNQSHIVKTYGGMEVYLRAFLASTRPGHE